MPLKSIAIGLNDKRIAKEGHARVAEQIRKERAMSTESKPVSDDTLEEIETQLEMARIVLAALETAATSETEADALAGIVEARNEAKKLIAQAAAFGACCAYHGSGGPRKLSCGTDICTA